MYSIRPHVPTFTWMCWSTTRDSDSTVCFAENDLEECLRQIQLNVTTLTHLTRLYLPAMICTKENGAHPECGVHRGVSGRDR